MLSAPEAWPPAPDRNERQVEILDEAGHPVEELRVGGEEDPSRAEDRVAQRNAGPERRPSAVVLGVRGANRERPDLELVTLVHALRVELLKPGSKLSGGDDTARRQHPERGKVEVVEVPVRDEHHVDLRHGPLHGERAPKVCDAVAQQRVGQETHAVELDENRRVTDEANVQ